jgi:hypothetical protein
LGVAGSSVSGDGPVTAGSNGVGDVHAATKTVATAANPAYARDVI